MKVLLMIGVLAIAGLAGYQWLSEVILTERLGSAIEAAIDDPNTQPIDLIRRNIHQVFKGEGISLEASSIAVNISASKAQTLSGKIISKAGFTTKTQKLTVRVTYKRRMWGTMRLREIERAKVFISTVTPPESNTNRILERARKLSKQFHTLP